MTLCTVGDAPATKNVVATLPHFGEAVGVDDGGLGAPEGFVVVGVFVVVGPLDSTPGALSTRKSRPHQPWAS